MRGEGFLWCKGKTLPGIVNIVFKCFAFSPFPHIIWIFTEGEGDGIESMLPFEIFSTLWMSYIPPPAPVTIATLPSNLRLSLLSDIIVFFDKKLYADVDLNSSKYWSQSVLQSTACTVKGVNNKIAQIWEVIVIFLANWLIIDLFMGPSCCVYVTSE